MVGHDALPFIVAGAGLALVGVSLAVERAASRLGVAERLRDTVERVKSSRWLGKVNVPIDKTGFERVDRELVALAKSHHVVALALLVTQWMLEAVGSWVILRALGVELGFVTVLAVDAALSVVRALAVFAPSGLGVQDLGYLAFFAAVGVPDVAGIGPAFLVLKRAKELFYVVLGFALLFAMRGRGRGERAAATLEGAS
jgi:uncharacterized protein (TIRG00374 family)